MKKRILTLVLALLLALSLLPAGAFAAEDEEGEYIGDGFHCGTGDLEEQYQRELQMREAVERMGETALVDKVEHYVNDRLEGYVNYGYEDGRIAHKGTFVRVEENLFAEADFMSFYYDEDGNQIDPNTKEVVGTYREFLDAEFPTSHFLWAENTYDSDGNLVECRYTDSEGNAIRDVYSYQETVVTDDKIDEPCFEDLDKDAYYYDAMRWVVENDITTGIDSDHFGPNLDCTRAQMVTFLWRAAGKPEPKIAVNPFSDVKSGSYYEKAVLWAVEQGITQGTGKGKFSPSATVTRGQTVTFLYRFFHEPAVQQSGIGFLDVHTEDYFAKAVTWALQQEITNGMGDNLFMPDAPCTRAQIVTFLYRAMA